MTPVALESPNGTTPDYVWKESSSDLPFPPRKHQEAQSITEAFCTPVESRIDDNRRDLQQQEVGSYREVFDIRSPFNDSVHHFSAQTASASRYGPASVLQTPGSPSSSRACLGQDDTDFVIFKGRYPHSVNHGDWGNVWTSPLLSFPSHYDGCKRPFVASHLDVGDEKSLCQCFSGTEKQV